MRIGYVRFRSEDSNPAEQIRKLDDNGCDKIFMDCQYGKDKERPGFDKMMKSVAEGDEVFVESFGRLANSADDLVTIVVQLIEKGASFISRKEGLDTNTEIGRRTVDAMATLVELGKEWKHEVQAAGISKAKENGVYLGRKPIETDWVEFGKLYTQWKKGEITARDFAKNMGLGMNTFYRRLREYEAGILCERNDS